jgi:alanine racemase
MSEIEARLTVDLDALAANHALLRELAGPAEVAPVVKADAYGLGMPQVARRLWAEGARAFFVARIGEGEALRRTLGPQARVLVFDGCPPGGADRLAAASLTPVLNSPEQVSAWGDRAAALHVDTGLNRLGLTTAQAQALAGLPSIELVISHLSCSHAPDHPSNLRQRDAFAAARALFPAARASLSGSAGIFMGEAYRFDLVRPGISLYGGGPFAVPDARLRPVVTFEAPILQLRDVAAGEAVGYGAAFTAEAPMRVAILAAGYADGMARAGSPGGYAWFGRARRALLGRVSMDLIAIDVTGCPDARPGEMVELIGGDVPVDEAATAAGTISYEMLTRLSRRAVRVWRG